jgi:hypothetical protein
MPRLRTLPAPRAADLTETPQRFLASAHDSVETVLGTLDTIRELRRQETGNIGGRLTSQEEDLLRAAIVFTGAGLDATLKRLVRDTLVHVIGKSEQAHKKLETFAATQLGTGEIADTTKIARYLVSAHPRTLLIEDYVYALTGSSLQSAQQVDTTAGALGIDDAGLRQRILAQTLRDLFTARNEVAHELDLQRTEARGDRARRSRPIDPTIALCDEGFEVAQHIVNAVGDILTA